MHDNLLSCFAGLACASLVCSSCQLCLPFPACLLVALLASYACLQAASWFTGFASYA
jgi:hypothetical protein